MACTVWGGNRLVTYMWGWADRELPFEDVWALFGEGIHPQAERLYETRLAPFLTQSSTAFWNTRMHYFKSGLYYQGGMVLASSPPYTHSQEPPARVRGIARPHAAAAEDSPLNYLSTRCSVRRSILTSKCFLLVLWS